MYKEMRVSVIIPCYNVADHIHHVVSSIPDLVDHIIVVDDACPEHSGDIVGEMDDDRLSVIVHEQNKGVGGAVKTGYRKALELQSDIIIKLDGDGQMDPEHIRRLIAPLITGRTGYTKGNRFRDFSRLNTMPRMRLFGNSVLSFLIKLVSGYWNLMDPTNGYTAIAKEALQWIDMKAVDDRYFFEISMLVQLNIHDVHVEDVDIPALYGNEKSNLQVRSIMRQYPSKLLASFFRRIFLMYFIYSFNMASIYILLGIPLSLFGMVYGLVEWTMSVVTGIPRTAGTIMLAALPLIIGLQMLLEAIHIDITASKHRRRTHSYSVDE